MSSRPLPWETAFLRDETGETSLRWMVPLLLLLILAGMGTGLLPREWDRALLRLSSQIPLAIQDLLR